MKRIYFILLIFVFSIGKAQHAFSIEAVYSVKWKIVSAEDTCGDGVICEYVWSGFSDPGGMLDDWYEDENGNLQFDSRLQRPEQMTELNLKGRYVGPTAFGTINGEMHYGDQYGKIHEEAPLPEVYVTTKNPFKKTFAYMVMGNYFYGKPSGAYGPYVLPLEKLQRTLDIAGIADPTPVCPALLRVTLQY